jgi:DNA-binding transcriptional LysR family regulator
MVCSKDYFLAKKKKIGADDLAGAKMILHTDKKSRTYANICKSLGLSPATMLGVLRLPSMDDCKYYALKGLGVAFIAEMYVRDELRDGRLVRLPGLSMRSPVSLISRNEKYESPAISAFKEAFVEHCRKMDVRN